MTPPPGHLRSLSWLLLSLSQGVGQGCLEGPGAPGQVAGAAGPHPGSSERLVMHG